MLSLCAISATHIEEVAKQSIHYSFLTLALRQSFLHVEGSRRPRQLLINREHLVQVNFVFNAFVLHLHDFRMQIAARV